MRIFPVLAQAERQHLLEGLTAGADQLLLSADEWAFRLGDDVAAHPFVAQLREEWPSLEVPDELCQQMMDFVNGYIQGQSGWPHIWAHILRVTGMAQGLAAEAGIEPAHAFLMGIFHDSGKLDEMQTGEKHEEIGAALARDQLKGHLPRQTISLIADVIAKRASASSPYALVLSDADKLDKIGATGIARRLSIERTTRLASMAFRRLQDDLNGFSEMHFPSSRQLAESKKAFTEVFLASFSVPGSGDMV